MAQLRLPRVLADTANTDLTHEVAGATLGGALHHLFSKEPGLRLHLLDETGQIRPHVSVFVDGKRAGLDTPMRQDAEIRVLQAVSGG